MTISLSAAIVMLLLMGVAGYCLGRAGVAWRIIELEDRVEELEEDSHPPIDLTPAMVDVLKSLHLICNRPPDGWRCTRPVGHHGPCAAVEVRHG